MAGARVTLNPRFMPRIVGIIDARMGAAMNGMLNLARLATNRQYPPASSPGAFPHKRSGGLQQALFVQRLSPMMWIFGYKVVAPSPRRPNADRSLLGLWMELGTGKFRQKFLMGSRSVLPSSGGNTLDTWKTGRHSSMEARPVLMPILMNSGPDLFRAALASGSLVRMNTMG